MPIGRSEDGIPTVRKQYHIDLNHAVVSLTRLLYALDPHKVNQDDYSITNKFAGEDGDILFSVYDGHGLEGHNCANFAKKNLPLLIAKYIRKKRATQYQAILKKSHESTKASYNPKLWPKLSEKDYEECCRKSFIDCNQNMHNDDTVRFLPVLQHCFSHLLIRIVHGHVGG
jgi:serine/threonine protein phosphatase PrpC